MEARPMTKRFTPTTPCGTPISVGDLVQVISWPCCGAELGYIFTVGEVMAGMDNGYCSFCGDSNHHGGLGKVRSERGYVYLQRHLKRIPPLSELEGEKRDEEITA